jgi:hypothetical protein
MAVTHWARKFALTVHVLGSVGWLGAVIAFLAVAWLALFSPDADTVRSSYVAMERIIRLAVLPLALASLATGLVSSLGSAWGLFRHYWVVYKLVLNVGALVLLLMYTPSITHFSRLAAGVQSAEPDLGPLRNPTHVIHASATILLLVVATVLAVYKPRGLTRYGWRKQHEPA